MYKLLLLSPGIKWIPVGYFMSLFKQLSTFRKLCLCCLLAIFAIQYAAQAQQLPTGNYANLTNVNGTLYFTATNASDEPCLWKTDGTLEGTVLIKAVTANRLTYVNGTLYFTGKEYTINEYEHSYELWKSDGTEAGTVKIKDVALLGPDYEENVDLYRIPIQLIGTDNLLYFTVNNSMYNFELWRTDGTSGGTFKVKNVNLDYPEHVGDFTFIAAGSSLYFTTVNAIFKTDGTVAGTTLIKSYDNDIFLKARVNGNIYFTAYKQSFILNQLWKTDGTPAGTVMVKEMNQTVNSAIDNYQWAEANGILYFVVTDNNGKELWKSDGTSQGTVMVKDIYPGADHSDPSSPGRSDPAELTNVNGTLFFRANDGIHGWELWKSNGTATGTMLVKDMVPGINVNSAQDLTNINGTLYFNGNDNIHGWELWKSNGTAAGTVLVKDINPTGSSLLKNFTNVNGTLFSISFNSNGTTPNSIWKSNGTPESTIEIFTQPYYPDGVIDPQNLTNVNGIWYFTSNHYEDCTLYSDTDLCLNTKKGFQLWRSDGTAAGTFKVSDYNFSADAEDGGIGSLADNEFIAFNNSLIFIGSRGPYYFILEKIDNNATKPVDLRSFSPKSKPTLQFTHVNGNLFFTVNDEGYYGSAKGYGTELWKRMIPPAGTVLVKDIWPGISSSNPYELRKENGMLYFTADDGSGRKLWQSDGTTAGTVPVNTCSASGTILREVWTNIPGAAVSAIPVNTPPTSSNQLTSFEAPTNAGTNYGQRIRGYLCVPATGNYSFYIAGDDNAELWLSTDEDPAKKVRIAFINYFTGVREWTKYTSQKSASIALVAGKKYYIEALHKESLYGDNLAVGWILPNTSAIAVIAGSYLSPFTATINAVARLGQGQDLQAAPIRLYPNPFNEKLTIQTSQRGKLQVSVTNNLGSMVYQASYTTQASELDIDLSKAGFKAGVYFVSIQTQDGIRIVNRVIKK